ncbi:MAG: MBL fold metallo-hydrolase [Oculatellaceae cyanobacterium Prado106]|jgi:glyoxylase-like metal-dependent hydrolase (beta-lactamase superfamily II)|nr:MBL fold metallo-hydrolase [Oculatellaceae cyanobacterium Prado106]
MISSPAKLPRPVFEEVYAFPPNRDTLGGTAYFVRSPQGNLLIDCPAWDELNQQFLQEQGGVRWLMLTHRGAIAQVQEIQAAFNCEVVIQEQEAYLLPGLTVTAFHHEFVFFPGCYAFWTCGHTPGSACVYADRQGGVLFTGRHLLPNQQGEPVPLRVSKTFHWRRQVESVRGVCDRFSSETLHHLCPGANTGFLRGQRSIDRAYERLTALDLEALLELKPGL